MESPSFRFPTIRELCGHERLPANKESGDRAKLEAVYVGCRDLQVALGDDVLGRTQVIDRGHARVRMIAEIAY